jgi:3'(2'), 5'-bisphosphate nucleotidase
VIAVARKASDAIMDIYERRAYQVKSKADHSPVTEADLLAHDIILAGLAIIDPTIPVLSEEASDINYDVRSGWDRYWLVDPLDGTREFIKETGEFTVNIALIENHIPVLGVVMVPVFKHCYWAVVGGPAYFQGDNSQQRPEVIQTNSRMSSPTRIAISRDHPNNSTKWNSLLDRLQPIEWVHCGSALKICLVAKGQVDLYPRFGPTGEWDTAAGHCILEAAGGRVVDTRGQTLKYNLRPSLINPAFMAVSCVELLSYIVDNVPQ